MTVMIGKTRKLLSLRKGDIISISVPFEENTRDYYNGYKPEEIRGKPFTDRFGQSGKTRMVVFIGHDGKTMSYLPITSKSGRRHDQFHQYELKDNSMTPKKDPNMKSFVEVDSVRALKVSYNRDLPYTGRIGKEDLENILHRIANNTLQFDSKRDQRGYLPKTMFEVFEKELANRGYTLEKETENKKVFSKPNTGQSISYTQYGMVYYHYEMTKEQVRAMVIHREGRRARQTLAAEEKSRKSDRTAQKDEENEMSNSADFSDNIQKLSEKEGAFTYAPAY